MTPQYILYRAYSANGELLYIGQSNNWPRRMREHSRYSEWFRAAARYTLEEFDTKEQLDKAERAAIEKEHPRYNHTHNQTPGRTMKAPVSQYDDDDDFRCHSPFGDDSCFKCGSMETNHYGHTMSLPEMVTQIEIYGDIAYGTAPQCPPCFMGYGNSAGFRDYWYDEFETVMGSVLFEAHYMAELWRRKTEYAVNGIAANGDAIEYAKQIVRNRSKLKTGTAWKDRWAKWHQSGKRNIDGDSPPWPKIVGRELPFWRDNILFAKEPHGGICYFEPFIGQGNLTWDQRSGQIKGGWLGRTIYASGIESFRQFVESTPKIARYAFTEEAS